MTSEVARKKYQAMENPITTGNQKGFLYLGVLLIIFIVSITTLVISSNYKIDIQRENELELLFIGHQFELAIESYYNQSPDDIKNFPIKLEDLLLDKRTLIPLRHIRKIYIDPMTNNTEWGLIKNDSDGITGVFSLSEGSPIIKSSKFHKQYKDEFNDTPTNGDLKKYSDWKFIYQPNAIEENNSYAN